MSKEELGIMRNNQMNILMEMLNTTKVIKHMEKHHLKHQIIQSLKKKSPFAGDFCDKTLPNLQQIQKQNTS